MRSIHTGGEVLTGCGVTQQCGESLTLSCPAKLNVFLEIAGKRPDGYHELDTVMMRTSFCDQLTIRQSQSELLTLRFSDATPEALRKGVPLDDHNLILRAAEAVRKRVGQPFGAEFILHKRIPPESGLGGGSSNAASALLLCRQFWNAPIVDAELHDIAASLGSDINFLLSGQRAAVCRGRGEIIDPIALNRRLYFVAVRPREGNSTAAVFRATTVSGAPESSSGVVENLKGNAVGSLNSLIFNRLTDAAKLLNPEMALLMSRMQSTTRRPVFMSGSGSTVFLVANSYADAAAMLVQIRTRLHAVGWMLEC